MTIRYLPTNTFYVEYVDIHYKCFEIIVNWDHPAL